MQTISYLAPGRIGLVERPVPLLGPGQVLLEVAAVGICGSDLLIWSGGLDRVSPPVVLGHEFSGTVVEANGVPGVHAGDRVVVEPLIACGVCPPCVAGKENVCIRLGLFGIDVDGAAAPFVAVPASRLHAIPAALDLAEAALAEPTAVALHMTERSGLAAGDEVLVLGGGPIGALVAAVCRARKVRRLVVSEPNVARRTLLEDLGFETFDPTATPIADLLASLSKDGFDVVFELTGVATALGTAVEATRSQGTVLLGGLPHDAVPFPVSVAVMKELTLRGARVYRSTDFDEAVRLLADGSIPAAGLITRRVSLAEGVSGAFERLRDSRDDMKLLIVPTLES